MRVAFDTNIYDLLLASKHALDRAKELVKSGELTIVTTHVQQDQLSRIPDEAKRDALLNLIASTKVPTSGGVLGLSKWGETTYGDDETNSALRTLIVGNFKHAADALIGVTALKCADALVTNDEQLRNRMVAFRPEFTAWSFEEFLKFLDGNRSKPNQNGVD